MNTFSLLFPEELLSFFYFPAQSAFVFLASFPKLTIQLLVFYAKGLHVIKSIDRFIVINICLIICLLG